MKFAHLLLLLCFSTAFASAPPKATGFYVQPEAKFTNYHDFASKWFGAEVGCAISYHVLLGASYCTPTSKRGTDSDDAPPRPTDQLTLAYAGAVVSYVRTLNQTFRLTTKLLIGDGYLGTQRAYYHGGDVTYHINRDRFTVIEPSVRLTTSLVEHVEFEFGTGWLQAYGIGDNTEYRNTSVSSIEFVVGVKVRTP